MKKPFASAIFVAIIQIFHIIVTMQPVKSLKVKGNREAIKGDLRQNLSEPL